MDYACLKGLQPADFFHWFGEICKIPHGSYKEEKLVAFLVQFAKERNLFCEVDRHNNVLMRVPASAGYEAQPPFLFQAHTDMIWRKDPGVVFDFETQPINLVVQDGKITAKGTTLGADNAVGIATMLALADGEYPHPELELLFTAAEEVGMAGIRKFDMGKLKARRMVNMDCGDSHVLCVTSAGSISAKIEKTFQTEPVKAHAWKLVLSGGRGGHSGLCAHMGLACGANLLGRLLLDTGVCLCQAAGQDAIIKQVEAVITLPEGTEEAIKTRFAALKEQYRQVDPNWELTLTPEAEQFALTEEDSNSVFFALGLLHTGATRMDENHKDTVLTSGQIKAFALQDGKFHLNFGIRAASDTDGAQLFEGYQKQLQAKALNLQAFDRYSGWPEDPESKLRQQFLDMHQKLFGCEMEIERVHGGIEVGVLKGAIPDMDAVGIAPTARGAHTTGEYLLIDEVAPYWQLLTAVLAMK